MPASGRLLRLSHGAPTKRSRAIAVVMNASSLRRLGEIAVMRNACTRRTSGPPLMESVGASERQADVDPAERARRRPSAVRIVHARATLAHAIVAGGVGEVDDVAEQALVGAQRVVGSRSSSSSRLLATVQLVRASPNARRRMSPRVQMRTPVSARATPPLTTTSVSTTSPGNPVSLTSR